MKKIKEKLKIYSSPNLIMTLENGYEMVFYDHKLKNKHSFIRKTKIKKHA